MAESSVFSFFFFFPLRQKKKEIKKGAYVRHRFQGMGGGVAGVTPPAIENRSDYMNNPLPYIIKWVGIRSHTIRYKNTNRIGNESVIPKIKIDQIILVHELDQNYLLRSLNRNSFYFLNN